MVDISEPVLSMFRSHPWPGNIRQLLNVIERALIVARGPSIKPQHLPPPFLGESVSPGSPPAPFASETRTVPPPSRSSISVSRAAERDQIRKALEAAGGKRMEAARLLGLSRRTLYRKLDKYGIT